MQILILSLSALGSLQATRSMASSSYGHFVALQKFIPFVDFFRDKIVQILIVTFERLYFPDGSRRARGLAVIQVLAEYGRCLYSRFKVVDLLMPF